MKLKPYSQGSLDGLCAVYSIVNATRIVAEITDKEARELFGSAVAYLDATRDLPRILTTGIGLVTIGGIFKNVIGELIPHRRMPFKHDPTVTLDVFWNCLGDFLSEGERRAVLLGVGGPVWDHWSVVQSITDRQIRFFDSHRLRRMNRHRCTTTRSTSRRPHVLCPTHTYFLW